MLVSEDENFNGALASSFSSVYSEKNFTIECMNNIGLIMGMMNFVGLTVCRYLCCSLLVAMDDETSTTGVTGGSGKEQTGHTLEEGDGGGFSAFLKHKHKHSQVDSDTEVQPLSDQDGTMTSVSAADRQSSDQSQAVFVIPEYVFFSFCSDLTKVKLWSYVTFRGRLKIHFSFVAINENANQNEITFRA